MEMFLLLMCALGALVFIQRQHDDMQRMQRVRVRTDERRSR